MSLAGRRNGFERDDLLRFADSIGIKKRRALEISEKVSATVRGWRKHAEAAEVAPRDMARIEKTFRSNLLSGW